MKKNILLTAACFICLAASAFNTKRKLQPNVTDKMEQALTNEFGECQNVEWAQGESTVQAFLKVNGKPVTAFFNENGEYMASTMVMSKENLPLTLQMAMDKKFADVSLYIILQKSTPEGTAYFFQGKEGKKIKVWKGTDDGDIELFKKLN